MPSRPIPLWYFLRQRLKETSECGCFHACPFQYRLIPGVHWPSTTSDVALTLTVRQPASMEARAICEYSPKKWLCYISFTLVGIVPIARLDYGSANLVAPLLDLEVRRSSRLAAC